MTASADQDPTRATVRAFILESFYVADARSLGDDASLLASGVLDSTGVIEVVSR